jgi:ABC-type nickel/cobalt efflux system permease component RcnA
MQAEVEELPVACASAVDLVSKRMVGPHDMMTNFWKRFNKASLDKLAVEKERLVPRFCHWSLLLFFTFGVSIWLPSSLIAPTPPLEPTRTHTHTRTRTRTHAHTHTHTRTHAHAHTHTHTRTRTHICIRF